MDESDEAIQRMKRRHDENSEKNKERMLRELQDLKAQAKTLKELQEARSGKAYQRVLVNLYGDELKEVYTEAREELRNMIPRNAVFPRGTLELIAACTRIAINKLAAKNGMSLTNDHRS
jgi:hypothetical protein